MAVPKKKVSGSRRGHRRSGQHHRLYRKHPMSCPSCGDITLPYNACPSCGTYKERQIFEIKVKEEEKEASKEDPQS